MIAKAFIWNCFRAALLLGALLACTRLEDSPAGQASAPELHELVSVPIYLAVAPFENGTPATKVDYEPEVPGYNAANAIKTFTILQFEKDAVGDGYTRVGNQVCYDWPLPAGENIALATSPRENIIFVIANATAPGEQTIPLAGGTTLNSFLESQNGNLLSALDALDGTGIWYSPNGGADRYLRMSATQVVPNVTLGTTLGTVGDPLKLKRNCAKVVVELSNGSSGSDLVNIESVQLRDINRNYHYVTNYTGFIDRYSPMNPRRFDETEQVFSPEKNPGGANEGAVQTYTFYIPANLRGSVTNTSQADKNRYAPQGATRLCVYGNYGSPVKSIAYTYYLGANLTSDFNIEANTKYVFSIDLAGKGNPATDSRVEDVNEVRFNVDANCYMLKPPSRTGAATTFYIPVCRAAVFWNRLGTNVGIYGAEAADADVEPLTDSTPWTVGFEWNKIYDPAVSLVDPVADGQLLVNTSGTGFNPATSPDAFIKIRIGAGMKGNAVVSIKNAAGHILWSWHLWVTDYNPYVEMTPVAGNYLYAVPGGEIHRYAGDTWTSSAYANAFIMDRNLGADAAAPDGADGSPAFGFIYEHGRKDPFPHSGNVSVINAKLTGQLPEGDVVKYNIIYSVHNPQKYISDGWTAFEEGGSILGANGAVWIDPRLDQHGADNCEAGKSIYDPCPPGWRVPVSGVWSDFNSGTKEVLPTHEALYYYPEGYDPLAPKGRVYYPFVGVRRWNTLEARNTVCAIQTTTSSINIQTYNAGYNVSYYSTGTPVRCIRLSHSLPY